MFFWNSLAFSMIQWIWQFDLWFFASSKSYLYIWKFSVHILLKPSLKDFEHYIASMWYDLFNIVKCSSSTMRSICRTRKQTKFVNRSCWQVIIYYYQECIALFSLNENIWKIKLTFLLKISSAIQILPEPSDVSRDTIHKH